MKVAVTTPISSSQGTSGNPILVEDDFSTVRTRENAVSPVSVVLTDNFITDASNVSRKFSLRFPLILTIFSYHTTTDRQTLWKW